jgi:magnesium transporter
MTSYTVENGRLVVREGAAAGSAEAAAPPDTEALRRAVWIDLLNPTPDEERRVQQALRVEVPTREEMQEIESSSRLYKEGEALFLTAPFLYGVDNGELGSTAITFVLGNANLVTVRYATPKAFAVFALRCQRTPATMLASPDAVMLHLFEQVVDRLADILERVGADMDRASQSAFRTAREPIKATRKDADLKDALITLGQVGEVTTRANETLLGLSRILTFVGAEKATAVRRENQALIKSLVRDVRSLVEHANFLNNKANFLLDAVLGIINVEQNAIIKTFTVASVALMPPTLIASIYGMNFEVMPELHATWGYPMALLMMVASAVVPVVYFKRKGWL